MPKDFYSPKLTNFEDVLSKTKSVAQTINKKSAKFLEISKKQVEYLDAKNKLSKAYENFGKMQYSAYKGEDVDENEYACTVADITAYNERIKALSQEIEKSKSSDSSVDFKSEADDFKEEVKNASKEATDVTIQQAKEFLKVIQNISKTNSFSHNSANNTKGGFTEADFVPVSDSKDGEEEGNVK
ncbi:MAG: hypothetical protein LIO43_04545 [Clostridiales bacterium]|nr:hypothetical protein [Clostridiales bacterium]